MIRPERLLVIDIDGLRQDVFHQALDAGEIPHLASLFTTADGGVEDGCHLDPVSTFPSITFCAQTTIFTGSPPGAHGVVGNQFFDRFGRTTGGAPRFYAFDIGDALAFEDAVLTFSATPGMPHGLVGQALDPAVPTLYEIATRHGRRSTVVQHMVSRGAQTWIRPDLVDIARFTKGGGMLGISAEQYDGEMIEKTLAHIEAQGMPDVLTVYFMGLDHVSHHDGPAAQGEHLRRVIDPLLGRLLAALRQKELLAGMLAVVVSDHGQIAVIPDDRHSLRMSFPFEREMAPLFDALGLDVNDKPGEGPACEAVVAANGGMAQIYLRPEGGAWAAPADFEATVLRVGRAFWEAHRSGRIAPDLQDALGMVLVRDVEHEGWGAPYRALTPGGELVAPQAWLDAHPEMQAVQGAARIERLACPGAGDVVLLSNYPGGFHFSAPIRGMHGGLHAEDSLAVGSFGLPGAEAAAWGTLHETLRACAPGERTSLEDILPCICALMCWEG